MLKSGVSHYVYMKRVWIFDETLSPACFIYYYTLASPQATLCLLICVGTILFPSQRASKAAPAKFVKERANKGFRGRKEAGEAFFSPSNHSLSVLVRLAKIFLSFFVLSDLERKRAPHV